tara:strand:- start:98 stop:574 length:477 start_codon:yes stop_codon:yes gene_type:complete
MQNNDVTIIDNYWMKKALLLAKKCLENDEVPVGALLVKDEKLISSAFNMPISGCDPTAHAEILTLRNAGKLLQNYRLPDTTLYVTIEPCTMCIGAIIHARVSRLVYGATEPKSGAVVSHLKLPNQAHYNHIFQVKGGVMKKEASELMTNFFRAKRSLR